MGSTVVIKVKYGDSLRRFNAQVVGEELSLGIGGLKEKIFTLFCFSRETELFLTYIDEDGDTVTLVDEEDLRGVVKQALNPIRITVELKSGKSSRPSSESFTPSNFRYPPQGLQNLINLDERIRATDLASKLSTPASVVSDPADYRSEVSQSYLDKISKDFEQSQADTAALKMLLKIPSNIESEVKSIDSVQSQFKSLMENLEAKHEYIKETSSLKLPGFSRFDPVLDSKTVNVDKKNEVRKFTFTYPPSNFPNLPPGHRFDYNLPNCGTENSQAGPSRSGSQDLQFSKNQPSSMVLHHDVTCDVYGVNPIAEPRYKSKVKKDYDRGRMKSNDLDYWRLDLPGIPHDMFGTSVNPNWVGKDKVKETDVLKLNSRFVQDVNIMDDTVMAPGTPFIKAWQLRNNGTLVWPQKSRLMWIGGDKLSNDLSVSLEIPEAGVPVDRELDIAVHCIAPELPGTYTSFWKLALPTGQLFGQRIWVLIKVDVSHENVGSESGDLMNVMNDSQPQSAVNLLMKLEQDFVPYTDDSHVSDDPYVKPTWLFDPPPVPVPCSPDRPYELSVKDETEQNLLKKKKFEEIVKLADAASNNYDYEESTDDDLRSVSDWDPLQELQDMGFKDELVNKMMLEKNNGSITGAVIDLMRGEEEEYVTKFNI